MTAHVRGDAVIALRTLSRLGAMLAGALALVLTACNDESYLPRNSRHYVPIAPETQALMREKGLRTHAPILFRAFKKESELEVWKQDAQGRFQHLKTYPMCRWSGQLGPKLREGDRQVPEGFYAITPTAMNPNSSFYLSFNVGYPNEYDRAHGRTGSLIMVHGDCSSMGCFAMTDQQIADIYALTREAFAGGQRQIQLQSYPFRKTPENLAKFRADPHMPFWQNLKEGHDHFEVTRQEVPVRVCNRRYHFGGACDSEEREPATVAALRDKAAADRAKVAEIVAMGQPAVKRLYRDGDQHAAFRTAAVAEGASPRPVGTTRNGVSRAYALVQAPIEIPMEQYQKHRAKRLSTFQVAELAFSQRLEPVAAPAPASASPAVTVAAAREPAPAASPASGSASGAPLAAPAPAALSPAAPPAAAVAATSPGATSPAAATPPAAATALAAPEPTLATRMLGGLGAIFGGGEQAKATTASDVEELSGRRVTIELPPRR